MPDFMPTDKPTFRQERQLLWTELESLLAQVQGGSIKKLSLQQTQRLGVLYRVVINHLAQARAFGEDQRLIRYLNDLAARCHAVIYAPKRAEIIRPIVRFYLETWPQTVRKTRRYQYWAVLIMICSALFGFAAAAADREMAFILVPDGMYPAAAVEELISSPASRHALVTYGRDSSLAEKGFFGAYLFTHNTQVGFTVFATGIFFGVISLLLQIYNGLTLGGFAAIFNDGQIDWMFWAWLLPHGVTELWAVIICGAAGLILGRIVLVPKGRPRADLLKSEGRLAVYLAAGSIPMFIFAGIVESFLRQSHLEVSTRLLFALASLFFWLLFFTFGGKSRELEAEKEPKSH